MRAYPFVSIFHFDHFPVTFEVRETPPGIGLGDTILEETVNRTNHVLEDDYGIAVQHERFTDIVSGVDPTKFSTGSGRVGEDVLRRGLGYAGTVENGKLVGSSSKKKGSGGWKKLISEDENDDNDDDDDDIDEWALEAVDLSEGNGIIRGRNGRPPTKVGTLPRKVEVLAEVAYISGLEGRVGGHSARQTVRALQPREIIVLGGPRPSGRSEIDINENLVTDEVTELAKAAQSFATGSKNIFTPSDGETVELAVGHAAFGVRIIDSTYQTAEEKRSAATPPDSIEAFEAKTGSCTVRLMDCQATGQKVALDGSIVLALRRPKPSEENPSLYLSYGDILLPDLHAQLIASGMKAEYSVHAGYYQLLVNGKIIVRRVKESADNVGRISVEGPLCEDFYTVRSIVYGQYVVL